jgi:Zn-dependent protease with chaperone function
MLRLLAVLLAVPVISFAVMRGLLYKFNSDWQAEVQKQIDEQARTIPDVLRTPEDKKAQEALTDLKILQRLPLQTVCEDPKLSGLWSGCDDVRTVDVLSWVAVCAAALGLLLVILIDIAGQVSQSSRSLLLLLFRPGLYLTILTLSAIIFLHAALAMAAIYYGEGTLLGRVQVGIVFAIGLGALTGTLAMIRASFSAVRKATTRVIGKKHDLRRDFSLQQFLKDLIERVGTSLPDNVVLGLDPNFFVTEADVLCLDGLLHGRTLYISLPLARILTRTEMASVLGHELGHYKGEDTAFSHKFYPIYRGTAQSLAAIVANIGEGARGIALLPAAWTLSYFYRCFASAENKIGRERELRADSIGAQLTSAKTVGTALLKVCFFAPSWNEVLHDEMREAISQGKQFVNLSAYWASVISQSQSADVSLFNGVDSRHLDHPTDSHPPLGVRLDALKLSVSDLAADALRTAPAHPAIELIADHEALEKELSDVEHALLAREAMQNTSSSSAPSQPTP